MKYSFLWYFARWICYVAELFQGLVGTVTFGFYAPILSLKARNWFLDISERNYDN